jgi:hypothetical protein
MWTGLMNKNTWVAAAVVLVVAVAIAFVAARGSNNTEQPASVPQTTTAAPSTASASTQATAQTQSAATNNNTATNAGQLNAQRSSGESDAALCSQFGQTYATSLTQAGMSDTAAPATSYFLESSHYAASQDACYFVLHNEMVIPSKQYGPIDTDDYSLYVGGMPTAAMLQQETALGTSGFTPSPVADCDTQTAPEYSGYGSPVSCNYYDPEETQGYGGYELWLQQYSDSNPAPMSYADFQSLDVQDMAAN